MARVKRRARKPVPASTLSPRKTKKIFRITFGNVTVVLSVRKVRSKRGKINRWRWIFSLITLFFAVGLFIGGNIINPHFLKIQRNAPESVREVQFFWPTKIVISKINLAAPVVPGGIINGDWILSFDSAQYLPTSGKPGEGFNTIIYAHRLPNLFAKLYEVMPGDRIEITDGAGHVFIYKIYAIESIDPKETFKLFSPIPNNLTLFTCDGWWDQKRLVVKARMNLFDEFPVSL